VEIEFNLAMKNCSGQHEQTMTAILKTQDPTTANTV
jgi:hypothetical protein